MEYGQWMVKVGHVYQTLAVLCPRFDLGSPSHCSKLMLLYVSQSSISIFVLFMQSLSQVALDIPQPWDVLHAILPLLRPSGVVAVYLPK